MADGPGHVGDLTPPRSTADLEVELRDARQQLQRLQLLLHDQADHLDRQRATIERVAALADLAEWAERSGMTEQAPCVLVSDLRRAIAVEESGAGQA